MLLVADSVAQPKTVTSRQVVIIASRREEKTAEKIIRAIQDQLSDLPVVLQISWQSALAERAVDHQVMAQRANQHATALLVIWWELTAREVYLHLSTPEKGRTLMRRFENLDPGALDEAMAIVIREAAEFLLKGGHIGVVGPPQPSSRSQPPKPQPPTKSWGIEVEIAYALDIQSSAYAPVHGPAAAIQLQFRRYWSIFAGYRFLLPQSDHQAGVLLQLQRHPLGLGGRFTYPWGRFSFGVSLGFHLDYVTEDVSAAVPFLAGDDSAELQCSLSPLFHARARIRAPVYVFFAMGLEMILNPIRYVATSAEGQVVVIDPWMARPMIMLGFNVGIL